MPQVTVSLGKWLDGQRQTRARPSILARIYPLDLPAATPDRPRTMMLVAGPTPAGGERVDLPAGKYLFEAYLPNGDVATETVTVHDGANAPVVLDATDSPHEWLSWQHLTGYSPTWTPSTKGAGARPVEVQVVTSAAPPAALPMALVDVWKGAPPRSLRWKPIKVPARADPKSQRPMVDGPLSVTGYLFGPGPWQDGGRYYGLVAKPPAGPQLLAVLPLPWHQIDFSGDALVDVMVDSRDAKAKGREWPLRVSVVVRDNVMASVFGYLSSGDLPAAGRVVEEQAVDMLYQKGENPLAAAGGAYALVRMPMDAKRPPVWVPWLQNLRHRFEWLPDGAILDGWAHLNGIGRPPNVAEAADAFVTAAQRGLPFYSAGVKQLFEGLTRVEAAIQPAARPAGFAAAFEFARRMALRVDVRQPFTVVRLG
jgi:hypothetical protein